MSCRIKFTLQLAFANNSVTAATACSTGQTKSLRRVIIAFEYHALYNLF